MGEWYRCSGKEVCRQFHVSERGLSRKEAEKRLAEIGENCLSGQREKKAWQVFVEQFADLLVWILLGAGMISALSGDFESTAVIGAVLILNAVLGTVQHEKARKSLESLRAMSAPSAHVLRDGVVIEIPSRAVVPGDLLILFAGDLVSADGRILESHGLRVNESALTGEAESACKQEQVISSGISENRDADHSAGGSIGIGDQNNMVFSGSLVTAGRGIAVVTATGMKTEIGKIAGMMNETQEKETPLELSMERFGSRLAGGIMLICALIFGLSLYRRMPVLEALMFAVALAVAAIPEALGSIVTIVQAMGTQQMAKEHAIIKDLKAVESLGCVSVICSDKTGTLTRNQMHVEEIWSGGRCTKIGEGGQEAREKKNPNERALLFASVLNNDGHGEVGDPMERALLENARQAGMDVEKLQGEYPRMDEIPFDSRRKRMTTLHRCPSGAELLIVKGAWEVVIEFCTEIQTSTGIRAMDAGWRRRIAQETARWAKNGFRVLAFAFRESKVIERDGSRYRSRYRYINRSDRSERAFGKQSKRMETEEREEWEQNLIFLGMIAFLDPPRSESQMAVATAKRAGIRTIMITGDHRGTAEAIAEKVGIRDHNRNDQTVTGAELDRMTQEELREKLERISVYARVSPEHKIRIVRAWQERGKVVAMTGDGVNDAPALRMADIGIAMGNGGTQVSRDAASMILTDDNFATIVKAVANGRNVYRNIRHAIEFLLSGNMAGILCVLYTSIFALPVPFEPVHLLFINLVTDSLPAIAIGMEAQEEGLLDLPPRNPRESIVTRKLALEILFQGGLIACSTMMAYAVGLHDDATTASTMAFASLTLARLFHGFNCRSRHSLCRIGIFSNLWTVLALVAGTALLGAVLFLPSLQPLFETADLSARQTMALFLFALLPTIVIQGGKILREALE
ncbi:cation-translocating P-type ATPase [Brotaphodocola sp.]|uniref:cation-translocating P-type ATPase n=1 Tax=Brotaphodocola sp. TaxID=3073577 RepID=UPI003D7EB67C